MAELTPLLPNAHIIRTYPNDYAGSDTESEGEPQFEVDNEDEEHHSISARLQQNQEYMDRQMTPPSTWILEPQTWQTTEGADVILIRKPTASNMSHRLLNPFIYRNIQNVGSLNDLAALLDTPENWEQRYNHVVADGDVILDMNEFRRLPDDTPESTIQFRFAGLVTSIATSLRIRILGDSETKIIVGGILARYQYDLRSKTDPHFLNVRGRNMIASEAKTDLTFASGEMWYSGSKGIQLLSALYAYNSPTFLFSQRQWKLFVENRDRNAVLAFPYGDDRENTSYVNSTLAQPMGTTFLKAIVICLLSQRDSLDESMKSMTLQDVSQVTYTPQKVSVKPQYYDMPEKPPRQSGRLLGQPKPKYVSGYDEQRQPIYSLIRVVPQEVVARIEDEIAMQEKKEYKEKTNNPRY